MDAVDELSAYVGAQCSNCRSRDTCVFVGASYLCIACIRRALHAWEDAQRARLDKDIQELENELDSLREKAQQCDSYYNSYDD